MIARIQIRRDTASNWTSNNPILTLGEIGYDTDTEKFKVGISNSSRWNDLPYELGQWRSDASGNISYGYASDGPAEGNVSINNDLFVGGDLTVKGTTTTINTEVATFKDDIIQLNLDVDDTGIYSGTLQSGFEVNRGNVPSIGLSSQKIYWDEADGPSGRWVIDTDLNVLGDIYSNGTALWRLNGNDIYFDNGYVAIGLDNPSSVLHIKDVAPIITLEDENNPAHIWQVGQNSDTFFINTETAADGSMFSILEDGKVGIGTDNPAITLHLKDVTPASDNVSVRLENDAQVWDVSNRGYDNDKFLIYDVTANKVPFKIEKSSPTDTLYIKSNGNVGVRTSNPAGPLEVRTAGDGNSDGIILRSTSTGGRTLRLWATGSQAHIHAGGGTEALFLNSSGGNVAIGLDNAYARLSVTRGDDSIELDHITSPDTNRILSYDRSANVEVPLKLRGSILTFDTNDTERIRVLNNGNVGIGKIPTERLHVYTETSMDHVMIDGTSGIHRSLGFATSGVRRWQLYADNKSESGTNSGTDLRIARYSDNGTYIGLAMEIQRSTGYVGLGVVPSEKLHINGSSGVFAKITDASTSGTVETGLVLERSGNNTDYRVLNNGTFRVQTATNASTWTDIMTITSAGNVDFLGDVTSGGVQVGVWTPNGNDIYYNTGNVGINTTTPSEKLEVLGNIKAINNISSATTKKYQITSSNGTDEYFYLGKLQHNNGANGYANIVVYNHVDYGLQNNTRLEVQINQRSGNFTGNATLYGSRVSGENIDILCYRDSASQNIYVYAKSDSFGLSIIEVSHLGGYDWQMSQNTEGTTVPTSSGAPVDGGTEIFDSSSNIDFMVSQNGFVGIGTLSPSEKLSVVGNITATGTITSSSDITLKENIELISDPIEKVKELSGYTFNKKGEDLRMVGLIAQEVEKVLPEAVHENQEGLKSLAYGNLVALLVECVKKQDERIESLEETIKKLK